MKKKRSMKQARKQILSAILAASFLTAGISMSAFAGSWQKDSIGWWYRNDDGTYVQNQWKWIDHNCYYFQPNGYILTGTTTPDGYTVNADGRWTENGRIVSDTAAQTGTGSTGSSAGTDSSGTDSRSTASGTASALSGPSSALSSLSSDTAVIANGRYSVRNSGIPVPAGFNAIALNGIVGLIDPSGFNVIDIIDTPFSSLNAASEAEAAAILPQYMQAVVYLFNASGNTGYFAVNGLTGQSYTLSNGSVTYAEKTIAGKPAYGWVLTGYDAAGTKYTTESYSLVFNGMIYTLQSSYCGNTAAAAAAANVFSQAAVQ